MGCPDEDGVLRFLDGQASDREARALEEHVDGCAPCRALVAELGRSMAAPSWQARSGGDVVEPGSRVGRYLIIERIGAGAMGVVYRARDPELDRDVALKLVRVLGLDPDKAERARDRLLREAHAMARLSDPNVVAVHDASAVGDAVFVAMELVDGVDVAAWLEAEARPWREIVDVFIEAGRGLAAAHQAGIVHRDFKPGNLLVGPGARVRVTDFGLAAVDRDDGGGRRLARGSIEAPVAGGSDITRSGTAMGTPAYMSPEARAGGEVDERSDQYSFAVSLAEALSGRRPEAPGAFAGSRAPATIDRIIERALSAEPADRFPSMRALVDALERARRPRRWRAVIAGIGAVAIVAAAAGFWAARRESPIRCDAGDERVAAIWNDQVARAIESAFRGTEIGYAPDVFASARDNLDRFASRWRAGHRDACEATHVRGEQSAALLDLRMRCLGDQLHRFEAAVDLLKQATPPIVGRAITITSLGDGLARCGDVAALTRETPRPPGADAEIDRIAREYHRVRGLATAGRQSEALGAIERLVAEAEKVGYDRMEAELVGYLGELKWRAGDLEAAKKNLFRAVAAAERARSDDIRGGTLSVLVAVIGFEEARHAEALVIARLAEAALSGIGDRGRLANLTANRGSIHFGMGDIDRAEADYERAHEMMLAEYGERDPRTGQSFNNLALIAEERGRHREAVDTYGRALSIYTGALGARHPQVALTLANRATSHANLGDHAAALDDVKRALEIRVEVLGPDHPEVGTTHRVIAAIATSAGDPALALEHAERARAILQPRLPAGHPEMASVSAVLGESLLGAGRHAEAAEALEKAIAIWEAAGVKNAHGSMTRYHLARALWETGERRRAIGLARQARSELGGHPDDRAAIDAWLGERR